MIRDLLREPQQQGISVPPASSAAVRYRMQRTPRSDTTPELSVRSSLHQRGFRFRVHQKPLPDLRRWADIVFTRARVAVFVDGCFWHGCPDHKLRVTANAEYWATKIARNKARDLETSRRLMEAGWAVVRIWEHDDPIHATERIADVLTSRGRAGALSRPTSSNRNHAPVAQRIP
jgi:DNA mismatch endonuclease (patch repair protein)